MNHRQPLTPRQQETLDAIRQYAQKHPHCPSVEEIAKILERSLSATHSRLKRLKDKKRIDWVPGANRTIRVI